MMDIAWIWFRRSFNCAKAIIEPRTDVWGGFETAFESENSENLPWSLKFDGFPNNSYHHQVFWILNQSTL